MSIRPIDHNVMVPKTQEVASTKHIENTKNRNIVESQFIQQEKIIKNNSKKVLSTEKTIYNKIKDDEKSKKEKESDREHGNKDDKSTLQEETNDPSRGHKIDIRI